MTEKTFDRQNTSRASPGHRIGLWLSGSILAVALVAASIWGLADGAKRGWMTGAKSDLQSPAGVPGPSPEERQRAVEKNLEGRMTDILATVFGRENVQVNLRAEMDFSARQTVTEAYDPDSQVARTTLSRQGAGASPAAGNEGETEERVAFEISKSTSTVIDDGGVIRKLSAAILVNSEASGATDGRLAEIDAVLRAAIGLDESRGDRLEIARLPFSAIARKARDSGADFPPLDTREMLVAGGLALAVMLALAFYGLSRRRRRPVMQSPLRAPSPRPEIAPLPSAPDGLSRPALSTSELRVRVAQLVDQNPDRALAIMRSWLHERANSEARP